ncbi:MAG: hypothetical protein IPG17_02395 [Sandaracinaceae bacterium]|nr:hypothetical protein [Sandaracinaceae bacterium]MBK7151624.1 hypothetical protein [Sandaracinaceae bacterium]
MTTHVPTCSRSLLTATVFTALLATSAHLGSHAQPAAEPLAVPAHNSPSLRTAPPMPPFAEADLERARTLLRGIVADDPELASAAYLPRPAFALIKGVANPDTIYDRLMREFHADVHALHADVPADARFERLEFSRRRSWVVVREEANRLPYWSARRNQLIYSTEVNGARVERAIEVRTLITWDDAWYITHLREFH